MPRTANRITLTREIAYAAGHDAADRQMRKASKPTYDELLDALEDLCYAVRDYDRFGSEDDLAERNRCLDEAIDLAAKARQAESATCGT